MTSRTDSAGRELVMADKTTDVLVGAYPEIDVALKDFDELAKLVE